MAGESGTLDKKAAKQATPTALDKLAGGEGAIVAAGVPEGYDAFLLAAIARRLPADTAVSASGSSHRARRSAACGDPKPARIFRAERRGDDLSGLGLRSL